MCKIQIYVPLLQNNKYSNTADIHRSRRGSRCSGEVHVFCFASRILHICLRYSGTIRIKSLGTILEYQLEYKFLNDKYIIEKTLTSLIDLGALLKHNDAYLTTEVHINDPKVVIVKSKSLNNSTNSNPDV